MATETKPSPFTLENLTFDATCSVGHPHEIAFDHQGPCQHTALFAASIHICSGTGTMNGDPLLCPDHLARITHRIQEAIRRSRAQGLHCLGCAAPINHIGDLIWNVTPLNA